MNRLNESQFYMWRTLFAVAHADEVVTDEELRFMAEIMEDVPFSEEQRAILNEDVKNPQDIETMFKGVTDIRDQAAFFKYAQALVHIDGDYGADEQKIILKLQEAHLKNSNFEDLVGSIHLELEQDDENYKPVNKTREEKKRSWRDILAAFKKRFIGEF